MERNYNNVVNICADGLIDVITDKYDRADTLLDEWVGKYLDDTEIGVMAFNVNYHVSYIPSAVWDTAWQRLDGTAVTAEQLKEIKHWSYKFVEAHNRGVEPYEKVIEYTKKRGARVWFSVRMNEFHYLANDITSALLWCDRPDLRIDDESPFDYKNREVRDYYLKYITELLENYDVDGIELDFLRGVWLYKDEPKPVGIITEFIAEIRHAVDEIAKKKGKEITLSARTYLNCGQGVESGLDGAVWAKRDLIDVLTISQFFVPTPSYIPISEWKELIGDESSCKINVTTDFLSYCTDFYYEDVRYLKNNTKTLKGFAANAFYNGADGIHCFNLMLDGYTKDVDLNLKLDFKEFSSYERAVTGERSHIYTLNERFEEIPRLPMKNGTVSLNTAKRPCRKYNIIIGVNGDSIPKCHVNGHGCRLIGRVIGKGYNPDIKKPPQVLDVSEVSRTVYEFEAEDISVINDGINEICFLCNDDVVWIQADVC